MKVFELIEELQKYPRNAEVVMLCSYDEGFCYAGGTVQYFELNDMELYLCNDEG